MTKRKIKNKKNKSLEQIIITIIIIIFLIGSKYISNNIYHNSENHNIVASYNNLEDIPYYTGQIYVEINNNVPYFSREDYTREAFEKYSDLDEKGRCGVAYANICKEIMPPDGDKRGDISSVKPTGWKQNKYYGEYLYNRCHLIGH